jgi:hypothetical protein
MAPARWLACASCSALCDCQTDIWDRETPPCANPNLVLENQGVIVGKPGAR